MEFVVLKLPKNKETGIRDHSSEANLFNRRAIFAFSTIILLIIVLLINLANLQLVNFNYYSTKSNNNRIEITPIPPSRGLIYDRNGTPLAMNKTTYQLTIIPDRISNLNEKLSALKEIVGLTDDEIDAFQKDRKNYRAYRSIPLKDNLTESQIYRFVVNQHLFPYVSVEGIQHRFYPYGASLTHILGYVSKINSQDVARLEEENKTNLYVGTTKIGKMGIERYYEDILRGKPGYEEVEVDSRNRIIRQLGRRAPQLGEDLYLSINLPLQLYIQRLLAGRKAAVVAIDPNNGEILALVSSPSYDSNEFVGGISTKKYNSLLDDPDKPLFNRALLGSYPPASTVKPFISIAALSEKVITPSRVVHDPGWWQLPNTERRYRDWLRSGHGQVNVIKAIEESVDTFFYQAAYDLGIDRISQWMTKFGYGERTGVDISAGEESKGIMPNRDWKMQRFKQSWLQGDTIPIGIGQGYWTATPIQMAKALTTLINNGKSYTPHFLLHKKSDTVNENPLAAKQENQISSNELDKISNAYWDIAKKGMYNVLHGERGTARRIFAKSKYRAAGKSGTAQVYALRENEIYDDKKVSEHLRDHAIFIAYAPYQKPTIALAIVIENGGGGSSNGGTVAKKILDFYLLGDDSTKLDNLAPYSGAED